MSNRSYSFEATIAIDRDDMPIIIDRYINSANHAYKQLGISNVAEVTSIVSNAIQHNIPALAHVFNNIHPEQCTTCYSSIICPAYHREITNTLVQRATNIPVHEKIIHCSSFSANISNRQAFTP